MEKLKLKTKLISSTLALTVGASTQSFAEPLDLNLSAFIDSSYDENPQRVSSDTIGIVKDERLDTLGVNIGLVGGSDVSNIDMDYRVVRDEFEKNSQGDETSYVGRSIYTLGNESTFYGLDASHELTRRLNSPDLAEVNSNINEVTTISLQPRLSSNAGKRSQAQLFGLYTDIDYKDNSFRLDTEQKGVQFVFDRDLTALNRTFVGLTASNTSFDGAGDLDYDYFRAAIGMSGQSQSLTYEAQLGSNLLSPELGEDETGAFFSGSLLYDTATTDFEFSARTELTAASVIGSLSEDAVSGGVQGVTGDEDRVEFEEYDALMTTQFICQRCELSLGYSFQKVENITLSENDTELESISASFSYRLNPRTGLTLDIQKRDVEFVNDSTRSTEALITRAALSHRISESISFDLYASNEDFDSDTRQFDSSIVGIRLTTDLY